MNAHLLSAGHYLRAAAPDSVPPPTLETDLAEACQGQHRRVDRFIQLALLGAARCAAGRRETRGRFLYLGSGIGPVDSNIAAQEQLCRDRQPPRPFHFVNTLGSSAIFYVSRELGLDGQGWWVARRGASLEALLELALADLELGLCSSALVGVVEECPHPYADHRRRVGAPDGVVLAEGSHWLLLAARPEPGCGALAARFNLDAQSLAEDLRAAWRPGDGLALGPGVPAALAGALRSSVGAPPDPGPEPPRHDSLAAARLTLWLGGRPLRGSRLHLVCGLPDAYARLEAAAPDPEGA